MHGKGFKKALGLVFNTRVSLVALFFVLSYLIWKATAGYAVRNYVTILPALFALQIFLNDFLSLYLASEVEMSRRWFSMLVAPGTILHELSHLFSALASGCFITEVSLFKFNQDSGLLGYVAYTQPKDKWIVLRNAIVGFSPFFGCGIILLVFNYLMSGGESLDLSLVNVESYGSVFGIFLGLASHYLRNIFVYVLPNPGVWLLLYLQFCFALGSAPSTQDVKSFFTSLFKHPLSTVFVLIIVYLLLLISEMDIEVFDVGVQSLIILLLSASILVLSYSIAVLLCLIPFVYVGDKFLELRFLERFVTFIPSAGAYLVVSRLYEDSTYKSVAAAVFVFLILLFCFKNKRLFLKR
jgi:hypothetical protein